MAAIPKRLLVWVWTNYIFFQIWIDGITTHATRISGPGFRETLRQIFIGTSLEPGSSAQRLHREWQFNFHVNVSKFGIPENVSGCVDAGSTQRQIWIWSLDEPAPTPRRGWEGTWAQVGISLPPSKIKIKILQIAIRNWRGSLKKIPCSPPPPLQRVNLC